MKNTYLAILIMAFSIRINAQDLATKIPSNAIVVVNIKGENITDLISLPEFSNSKLGQTLGKEISRETRGKIESVEELGLNLNKNFYYFLDQKENVLYSTFMIPFSDSSSIPKLFHKNALEIVEKGNLSYLQTSYDGSISMWNSNMLVIVIPSETDYYDDYGLYDLPNTGVIEELDAPETVIYEAEEVEEIMIEPADAEEAVAESVEIEETVIESTENYEDEEYYNTYNEESEKRRIARQKERDARNAKRNTNALTYAINLFNERPTATTILQNPKYIKALGKGNHEMLVWMDNFAELYTSLLPTGGLGLARPYQFLNIEELYKDMSLTGKLNFEHKNAIMTIDYSMSEKMAKTYKPIYEGKFNKNFFNYINEDKLLGYLNVNLSTAGILEAYPELIRDMFNTKDSSDNKEVENIAAIASSASQLFSLLIDEEGAAKIVRGDMLLLLTDLREKEITYTDYEYDEDYNYTKVEKTKTENVPDFLFLFTSEQEKMFTSLMNIGVSEDEVSYENGIYSVKQNGSFPFNIYAMFKDNTVLIGSSLAHLTHIKNDTYPSKLSNQIKKDLSKSSTSFYVNGKNILSKVPSEAFPRQLRENIDFLTNNTENLRVNFSKIKGNTFSGKMILETPEEGHKNSFVYFINLIDQIMD